MFIASLTSTSCPAPVRAYTDVPDTVLMSMAVRSADQLCEYDSLKVVQEDTLLTGGAY